MNLNLISIYLFILDIDYISKIKYIFYLHFNTKLFTFIRSDVHFALVRLMVSHCLRLRFI